MWAATCEGIDRSVMRAWVERRVACECLNGFHSSAEPTCVRHDVLCDVTAAKKYAVVMPAGGSHEPSMARMSSGRLPAVSRRDVSTTRCPRFRRRSETERPSRPFAPITSEAPAVVIPSVPRNRLTDRSACNCKQVMRHRIKTRVHNFVIHREDENVAEMTRHRGTKAGPVLAIHVACLARR